MNHPPLQAQNYQYKVVRQFTVMTIVWGIVGMLVGVIIAAQLAWPALNFDLPWLTFSRLRPLHTNAVIFAFGGSALFATSYYIVQRTCHAPLFAPKLASFTFWGWQLIIVLAAVTLPLGFTQGKEYAELIWPIDLLIAVVWVSYGIVFFGTLVKRNVSHIYVANWFYAAIRPDGGVIGAFSGDDWTLTITPTSYSGLSNIQVFGLTGSPITLEQNTSPIVFSAVPEPSHTLLAMFGVLPLLVRRNRKQEKG